MMALRAQDGDDIGEVLLALRVVGRHPLDRVAEQVGLEGVDAGVDLVHGALLRGRVRLLDDLQEGTGVVPDDPAVAMRVGQRGGEASGAVSTVATASRAWCSATSAASVAPRS